MALELVRTFVTVARSGGFAPAGRLLNAPRSTLSRQISRLEDELGVRLMERTTRAVRLTEAGQRYLAQVAPAVDALESANRQMRDDATRPRGVLRVSAPIDVARDVLVHVFADMRRRAPDVEIELDVTQRRVNLVAEGFDVALRGGAKLDDSSIVAKKLATQSFALYASPRYLAQHGAPRSLSEVAEHALVAFAPGGRALPWGSLGAPNAWLRSNELGTLREAIASGLGIGTCETSLAARDARLVRVLPDTAFPGGSIYAVYPSGRRLSAKVRVFISALQAFFAAA